MKDKNIWAFGIIAFTLLFIASAVIFRVSSVEILPTQFYGALIGVVITAIITVFLLQGQTAQGMRRDKDIKIFEQKIGVYSEFTEKMWAMLDDGDINDKKLKELRTICFRRLVFYLNSEQINKIYEQIDHIDFENDDTAMQAVGEITYILQNSLNADEKIKSGNLIKLFNSFNKDKEEISEMENTSVNQSEEQKLTASNIRYWHFNILDLKKQVEAFKKGNWVLALIEYGENWRTNAVRQIKPNDVVLLFKRGGSGYIGAFKVLDPTVKILEADNEYSEVERAKYDIYDGLYDGASLCSNILVAPIAYNFKGVGYKTVRRRTIERINDMEAVTLLLNRFNGNDLDENRLIGKGYLDNDISIAKELDDSYFREILKQNNL